MKNKDRLLSDILKERSNPLQSLKQPLSLKLPFFVTAIVFVSISLVILATLLLQTQNQFSADDFIGGLLPENTEQIIYYNLIWGAIISCLASLGVFFLSKKLTTSTIEPVPQALASSDDETARLTRTITKMSTQLKELKRDKEQSDDQLESLVHARTKGIQQMHDRLENILETSSQGFWRVDNDMVTQEINPRMAEILKYGQEDVMGKSIMEFVGVPNRTILHKQIHQGKSLLSTEYEIELKQESGTFIPCLFNATPLLDEQGIKRGSFIMVTDISALKQTEKNLEEAKQLAEHASHVKSSFLANMSHEIRTPLNGIIGSLELLNRKTLDAVQQKQFMKTAQESADFLLMLLNDILDLSKIEADKIELEEVAFLPGVLLEQLQSMFTTQAQLKNVELTVTAEESVPEVLIGDEIRLTQICTNLLSNAIKFTHKGTVAMIFTGEVVRNGDLMLKCCVSDTGIGLSQDKQKMVFDSFSQADTSTTREFGGTGLGLALCKKLCALMGGEIHVESIEDEGTEFYFTVSLKIGEKAQLAANKKEKNGVEIAAMKLRPLDILVVDDNTVNRKVAEMFLSQDGHKVKTAMNGLQALQILSMDSFDCVLMDIQMPKMDGVSATKFIRGCEQKDLPDEKPYTKLLLRQLHDKIQGTHTPIVALTANVFQSDKQKYLQAGMDDYLAKPIRGKDIHQALLRVTEHIELEKKDDDPAISSAHRPEPATGDTVTLSEIKEHLETMYSFDSKQIEKLIQTSVTSILKGLDLLDLALQSANATELRQAAHKLKGTLANLGLDQPTELAKKIECSAKDSAAPHDQWLKQLHQALDPLQKYL